MAKLVIHPECIEDPQILVDICPFGAMELTDKDLQINAACKMCKLCVRKGPKGAVTFEEDAPKPSVDKSNWRHHRWQTACTACRGPHENRPDR